MLFQSWYCQWYDDLMCPTPQVLQIEHTLGHHPDDSYHTNVIRTQLKNNLDSIFPTMYDEVSAAFNDNVLLTEGGIPQFACEYRVEVHPSCGYRLGLVSSL